MNKQCFIGRLGREIEVRKTSNGRSAIEFSLADTEKWKTETGEEKTLTTWLRCKAYGRDADNLARYLRKGDIVYVEGKHRNRKYQTESGETRYDVYMQVQTYELLPNKRDTVEADENQISAEEYYIPEDW